MASLFTGKLKSTIKSKLEEFIVTDNSNIIFEKTKEKDFCYLFAVKSIDGNDLEIRKDNPQITEALKQFGGTIAINKISTRGIIIKLPAIKSLRSKPIFVRVEKVNVNITLNDRDNMDESEAEKEAHIIAKRNHLIASNHLKMMNELKDATLDGNAKSSGYFQKLLVDVLQNIVVEVTDINICVAATLPNGKRFKFGFAVNRRGNNNDKNTRGNAIQNGITIRNKDLSKDNTIRELIVKNVCIYCTKADKKDSRSDNNNDNDNIKPKARILQDFDVALTVVNRGKELTLIVNIDTDLRFILLSKQYLNLTYVATSLSNRLDYLQTLANGKVAIIEDGNSNTMESNNDQSKNKSKKEREYKRYIEYYKSILLSKKQLEDKTMPLDTMIPKISEYDTLIEKDALWAVKNIYGRHKWAIADIQSAHAFALQSAIDEVRRKKEEKKAKSLGNSIASGFSFMKNSFFGSRNKKTNDKKSQPETKSTKEFDQLQKDLDDLQEQETALANKDKHESILENKDNLFVFFKIEKNLEFILARSKKTKEKKLKKFLKFSLIDGVELNANKNNEYVRVALRVGLIELQDIRETRINILENGQGKSNQKDDTWNVFNGKESLTNPYSSTSARKASEFTFRFQKLNKTLQKSIYARILVKSKLVADLDLIKDVKNTFAAPVGTQGFHGAQRLAHEVKTLGNKEAKSTTPEEVLDNLLIDVELLSPTIVVPKNLSKWRNDGKDNLNTIVFTLGKLKIKSQQNTPEITLHLISGSNDANVLDIIGNESLSKLKVIDNFEGDIEIASTNDDGTKVNLKTKSDEIKVLLDNDKLMVILSILDGLLHNQGTLIESQDNKNIVEDKGDVVKARIKSKPALLGSSIRKIVVGETGYTLSVNDIFVPGTYTNVIFPTNVDGYVFDLDNEKEVFLGNVKIKVDENNTTVTNNVVNLVAINANDDRIACSLHLSSNKEDKDDLETVKYNQSVTVDLEVPNLILEINEYEEKSAFAIEVSSEGENTNKISYSVAPKEDAELNLNFNNIDIAIRDLTSKELALSAGLNDVGLRLLQGPASKFIRRDNSKLCILPTPIPTISECTFKAKVVLHLEVPSKEGKLLDTMKSMYIENHYNDNDDDQEEIKEGEDDDDIPPKELFKMKEIATKYENEMLNVIIGIDGKFDTALKQDGGKHNNFFQDVNATISLDEKGLSVKYSSILPEIFVAPYLCSKLDIKKAFCGSSSNLFGPAENLDTKTKFSLSETNKESEGFVCYICEEDKAVVLTCQQELLRRILPLQQLGSKNERLVERSKKSSSQKQEKENLERIGDVEIDVLSKDPLVLSLELVEFRLKDKDAINCTNLGIFYAANVNYHMHSSNVLENKLPIQNKGTVIHADVLKIETILENSSFNVATDLAFKKSIEIRYQEDENAVKTFTKTDMTVLSLPKLYVTHKYLVNEQEAEERVLFPFSIMMELEDSDTKQQVESGKYNALGKRIVKMYIDPIYLSINVNSIQEYLEMNDKLKKIQLLTSSSKKEATTAPESGDDVKPTTPTFINIVQLKGLSVVLQQDARVITSFNCDNAFTTGTLNMAKSTKNMFVETHVTGIELNAIVYNDVNGRPILPRQSPIIENWSFSLFVEKFNDVKRMSGFSKGLRASCVSPQILNLNVDPSVIHMLKELQFVLKKAIEDHVNDNDEIAIHQIGSLLEGNDPIGEVEEPLLETEEKQFEKLSHRFASTDKPQIYGEEHTGDEDLTKREQLVLSLKSGTFDKLADFAGSLYEASKEDMDSVANVKENIQNKMAEQGDRILPSYSALADGTVRVYTRNLINDPIQVKIEFTSEKGKPVGGDEKMLQPRKSVFIHDYTPDKVEVAAWINDQPLDINNADQRIDNDPKIGHQYHVSISKYTNDKMGIEIIISVYSVCLVINNMDYYIDVIEKEKNLQGVDSDDFTHVPDLPDNGYEVEFDDENIPQNLKFMDHSKYGTGENKKTGEVMEVQVRLSGINANEDKDDTTTTGWSEPFSINTVGTEGQLDLKVPDKMEQKTTEEEEENARIEYKNVGINISSTEFTKLLSIAPRYLLLDKSSHRVHVRQARLTDESWLPENQFSWEQLDDWHSIQDGELHFKEVHFSKWKGHVLSSIQIKIEDEAFESCWSNELHVHAIRPRRMHFRICDKSGNKWVYLTMIIQFLGATTFIIIEDAITNAVEETKFESSLTVENKTGDNIFKFRQFNYVKHVLSGGEKVKKEVPDTKQGGWFSKSSEAKDEEEDFIAADDGFGLVVGVCPGLNMPNYTEENAPTWVNIDPKSKNWLFYDYDNGSNNQFEIADGDGNVILSSLNIVKTGTTKSEDGGYLFEVSAQGSDRVIRISSNEKDNRHEDNVHEFDQAQVLTISLTGIGVSLLNNNNKISFVEEVCYIHIQDVFGKFALNNFKTITNILYCSSIQIDNQTNDGNSVILSPAIPSKPDEEFLALPGVYDEFLSVAVAYFLKHVDLWKIKRSADEHVENDVTLKKEREKKEQYDYQLKKRLIKEFCLFILLEEPWASEPKSVKDAWDVFRKEISKAENIDDIPFIIPYEDMIINQIDVHVESTTLFFFAFEKTSSQHHTVRHLELDTPYFDLKIHEEFVFSLLSSVQELFKSIKDFNSSEDSDAVANQEKEEKDSDPNLKLRIIQEQYLTIQSSLTEAQQDDDNNAEYFFEKIDLHPVEVRLSYNGSAPGSEKKLSLLNTKSRGLGAISSLPSIDSLIVILASLHQTHAAYTLQQFSRLVGKFYTDQAMARLYKVVFKISVLDSPVRAVAGLGSGVSQLLQTPGRTLKALAKGDVTAAAKQLGGGICGLARAIVGGGAKVAGGAVGGVGFVFKKVTGVSAVTKTLFSPASNLFDYASGNLEGVYDNLVEDRLKSNRKNVRVRLPRKPDSVLVKYCYLDALTLHLTRTIDNFTLRKGAKIGRLVPAVECVQKGKFICSCYVLYQKVYQHDKTKKMFIEKESEQFEELSLLILSSWHLFCLEAKNDIVNKSNLLWAIPFRRILDINVMTVLANGSSELVPMGQSYLELVVTYATDDKDDPDGIYHVDREIHTRQRRIAATNRRHLYALYLLLRKKVFALKIEER